MNQADLQRVKPGFHDVALGSQAVFRCALTALSHPGRVVDMPAVAELPGHGHGAAAVLLLALVDSTCSVWLSPLLTGSDAAAWLRFHTGCRWAESPAGARWLWIAVGDALPALASLDAGSDAYPDQSATCVIEVDSFSGSDAAHVQPLSLVGPGIADTQALSVAGLPDDLVEQWQGNHDRFPRGVDVFLATPTQLAGLPRTTRVCAPQEA